MEQTDLQGMLGALTQNPELMGKLRQIAGGLAASAAQAEHTGSAPEPIRTLPVPSPAKRLLGDLSTRKQLLSALRPFLQERRRQRLDDILNLICLLEAAESTGLLTQLLSGLPKKEGDHVSP